MLCILHYFPTISQNRNHSCRGQAAFIPPGWKRPDPLFCQRPGKEHCLTPENIPEFRKAGCLGVGLASSLMPKDKVAVRDWDACAEYVHMLLTKAKGE